MKKRGRFLAPLATMFYLWGSLGLLPSNPNTLMAAEAAASFGIHLRVRSSTSFIQIVTRGARDFSKGVEVSTQPLTRHVGRLTCPSSLADSATDACAAEHAAVSIFFLE